MRPQLTSDQWLVYPKYVLCRQNGADVSKDRAKNRNLTEAYLLGNSIGLTRHSVRACNFGEEGLTRVQRNAPTSTMALARGRDFPAKVRGHDFPASVRGHDSDADQHPP